MTVRILKGDCRDVLRSLPDESVHCVVTSPPYWGLRDYGTAKWEGGDPGCSHVIERSVGKSTLKNDGRLNIGYQPGNKIPSAIPYKEICADCGARRIDSQIGLESSFAGYVEIMRNVFAEVRRVLRKDGTLWLNLGDSYNNRSVARKSSHQGGLGFESTDLSKSWAELTKEGRTRLSTADGGLKEKDLMGIPWRVAFALQADGWYLRSDIIWSKPNPMPESVTDRPTKAHEYLFLLTKSQNYYYDAEAIKEDATARPQQRLTLPTEHPKAKLYGGQNFVDGGISESRNRRSVWEIATSPFSEAHFATFPPALIEPCIKAGTSEKGCCAKCGAPWKRQTESSTVEPSYRKGNKPIRHMAVSEAGESNVNLENSNLGMVKNTATLGWSPSCSCPATMRYGPIVPCTVLDPFGGAGTTGLVADRLGRNAILIELNPQYAEMAERRLRQDAGFFAQVAAE